EPDRCAREGRAAVSRRGGLLVSAGREPGRRCELIAIGTELTSGPRQDTNSVWLRREMMPLALDVGRVLAIPDDPAEIEAALREARSRADLVICTGGLGPTDDDRTLEVVCALLGRPAVVDEETARRLRVAAARRGRTVTPEIDRMAHVPAGATVLTNDRGAAPGLLIEDDGSWLVMLPGVPDEMRGLFAAELLPRLEARFGTDPTAHRLVRLVGVWESDADRVATPLCEEAGAALSTLALDGEVELHVGGLADAVDGVVRRLEREFGDRVVSVSGQGLAAVVLDAARRRHGTVAVAESCTGGRVAARLTAVPGSSDVFRGGVVAYANDVKSACLGVSPDVIRAAGAVSREVVEAMGDGVRCRFGCDHGVAISGVAGPGGGTPEQPVGTVWLAAVGPTGISTRRVTLSGGRERVQNRAAALALGDLLRMLRHPAAAVSGGAGGP
ncbi:MAG: CinA family nicotinamide mononucleotide deamidase-related protein, partial [Acidobacteriota bacterium]